MRENAFRNGHRGFGLTAIAIIAVVAVPGHATAAPITFTLGGTARLVDVGQTVSPPYLSGVLSGKYNDGPTVSVPYPASVVGMDYSVALGADRLVAEIQSTPDEKRALGMSQGAIAIAEAKRRLMALPADHRPAPDALTFVAIADPTRPRHGALAQLGYRTPDVPYDTVSFTREYDGFADLPDRFNILALVNAAAGIVYVHPHYGKLPADIPAGNITKTVNSAGGTVTDVLIPNAHLPMLQPWRDIGVNVDGLEAVVKPMVDAGYSRNDVKPKPKAVAAPAIEKPESESKHQSKKPHRNVQASDATHEADHDQPSKATDDRDEKPQRSTPAAATGADESDQPADNNEDDAASAGDDG